MQSTHLYPWEDRDRSKRVPCLNFVSSPDLLAWTREQSLYRWVSLILWVRIIHFILFVFACIATHKWRKANKRAATESRNVELQYHRSPEEHMAQQPPAYSPSAEGSARTPASVDKNPFKDPAHVAPPNEDENPFRDVEHAAVKYA